MPIYIRDNIYKIFGFILSLAGLLLLIVGVAMFIDKSESNLSIAFSSLFFFIPGIILLHKGRIISKEEEKIIVLIELVNTYRRIALSEIINHLKLDETETLRLLAIALKKNRIKGFIDRETREFITESSETQKVGQKVCRNCGDTINKTYLQGETIICQNCGSKLN